MFGGGDEWKGGLCNVGKSREPDRQLVLTATADEKALIRSFTKAK
jgi:hypothetical protein